jgi:membrane-associated phospholipid phosphatase
MPPNKLNREYPSVVGARLCAEHQSQRVETEAGSDSYHWRRAAAGLRHSRAPGKEDLRSPTTLGCSGPGRTSKILRALFATALFLCVMAFVTLPTNAGVVEDLHRTEIQQTLRFQEGFTLADVMKGISHLGTGPLLAVLGFIFLSVDSRLATRLLFVYFLSSSVRDLFAMGFRSPRPYWLDSRVKTFTTKPVVATSYSFPSGHATIGTSLWVYAASALNKPWAWIVGVTIALLICVSRIYLGMHYISDVVAGFCLGLVFVLCFRAVDARVTALFRRMSFGKCIASLALAALSIVGTGAVVRWAISGSPDPAEWAAFAERSRKLLGLAQHAGGVLGLGLGVIMSHRWAPFDGKGPWPQRFIRSVIGAATVGPLIWWARKKVPVEPEALGLSIRFGVLALAAWSLSFLLPWIFLRTGLAQKPKKT